MEQRRHSIDEDSVAVLHREADWFRRGVAEVVQIQREAPTLNRGRERHILQELLPQRMPRAGSLDPHVSVQR